MSNDRLPESDRRRRPRSRVQRELTAEVADPAVDAFGAASGIDPEDHVDLRRGAVDVASAQPGHGQVHAGQGHLAEPLLFRRCRLEHLHRFVGGTAARFRPRTLQCIGGTSVGWGAIAAGFGSSAATIPDTGQNSDVHPTPGAPPVTTGLGGNRKNHTEREPANGT